MDATNKTSKKLIRFLGDNAITLCLVVLVVVIICINPKFFSFNVLRDVLLQNATKLIMAWRHDVRAHLGRRRPTPDASSGSRRC